MDLRHVRMWTVHKPITTKDEGCRANINKDAPFRDGIPSNSWWYWFKQKHLVVNIRETEGLEVYRHKD
jgi:hypothetical protein